MSHNKLKEPDKGINENPAMMETVVLDCDHGGSDGGVAGKIAGDTTGASSCSSSVSRPPPPFLRKMYNMLENDEIKSLVSWSSKGTSFVIRNHRLFAANVLPLYFKHCNFESFIRQLNEYGFKKIIWENKWRFKNEHFRKGEWHLLKNIKRKNQLSKSDERVLDGNQTSIDDESSCSNKLDEEFKILMNEHELLKMEILNKEERQYILQKRVESLKNQVLSNEQENQKIIMSAVKMISSRLMNFEAETATEGSINGKRKFEEMEKQTKLTLGSEVGSCSAIPGHDDAATNDSELSFEKLNRHEKILSGEGEVGGHDHSKTMIWLENLIRKPFDEWADYINEGNSGGIWP